MVAWYQLIFLYMTLVCLYCRVNSSESVDCNPSHHNIPESKQTAIHAKQLFDRFPTAALVQDRLLVMILFSQGFSTSGKGAINRLNYLNCALRKMQTSVMKNTVVDIFIWVQNSTLIAHGIPSWLNTTSFPRVNVIAMPEITWKKPCGLLPDDQWVVRRKFDLDYYLMGRWRLTFSLDFAKEMGYEYHLQFDDDAVLLTSLPYNLVHHLRNASYDMVVNTDLIGEVAHVVLGLPELTAYWLKVNRYTVQGTLLKNLKANNLQGLTSEGWNRMYHPGYFLIFRVGFWYQESVQSYLTTILRSERDVEGRWQEQAVMNMIRLVFIPEKKVFLLHELDIGHDRHKKENYITWCKNAGIDALYT